MAFVLKKRIIVAEAQSYRKVSIHGEDAWRCKWGQVAGALLRKKRLSKTQRRANAIACLTRFFRMALVGFRTDQAVKSVVGFSWDMHGFVGKDVRGVCDVIGRFARIWLARKAWRFATAYTDEIFESAFVRLCPNLRRS